MVEAPFRHIAFTFPLFGYGFDLNGIDYAMQELRSVTDTIQINPLFEQETIHSNTFLPPGVNPYPGFPNMTPPDSDIELAFNKAAAAGLKIELKISTNVADNTWSGLIDPSDPAVWFNNYKNIVVKWAAYAEEFGCERLIITNEALTLTTQYREYWVDLIEDVRGVFHGKIGVNAVPNEAEALSFGDQLDFIGLSLYPVLTNKTDPTVSDLIAGWHNDVNGTNWVARIQAIHEQYGLPIEISEIAFFAYDGAAANGNFANSTGTLDQQEQLDQFEAFFTVFSNLPARWFEGVTFWRWIDTFPDSPWVLADPFEGPTGSHIDGHLAEQTVRDWISGLRQTLGLNLQAAPGGSVLDGGYNHDTLQGNSGNDELYGGPGTDLLTGLAGNDTLNAGSNADTMLGGLGDDTYVVDDANDIVDESSGGGTDTVESSVSFSLSDVIHVTGTITSLTLVGKTSIDGTGNAASNIITGNDDNNILAGLSGADKLIGGAGTDTASYSKSIVGVVVSLMSGSGTGGDAAGDALSEIENLIGSNVNDTLTGSNDANILDGLGGIDLLSGGIGSDTLIGGTGGDTYIVDSAGDVVDETGGDGSDTVESSVSFSLANVVYAIGSLETLTLTGKGAINGTGNQLDNVINGNSGSNILSGGANGAVGDTVSYAAALTGVIVNLATTSPQNTLGAGTDALSGFENLTGSGLNDTLAGSTANNVIDSLAGSDMLNGGLGADTMLGGAGDDTYVVDNAGDVADDSAGDGIDRIQSAITFSLLDSLHAKGSIEDLTLIGKAAINGTGNAVANGIVGNSGANTLIGNGGDDTLNGGAGADSLAGGTGNDSYFVDNLGDKLDETGGNGNDTVNSSVTYVLADGFEKLTLAGTGAISGTGNALDNLIVGNSGANVLKGLGGADSLQGGLGNDTYWVGAGDVATEAKNAGTDLVQSEVDFTLGENLERLTLVGAALKGTGNDLNNVLIGNGNANILDGGVGKDTMTGGLGDDVYIVDTAGETVAEAAKAGTDTVTVNGAVSYVLGANVENLVLLDGFGDLKGTGNTLNNALTGNDGANSLVGGSGNDTLIGNTGFDTLDGGIGADSLTGGAGNDLYVQDSAIDVINEAATDTGDELRTNQALTGTVANIEHYTFIGPLAVNFTADSVANRITGTAKNDTITGAGGDDTLNGGAGNDVMTGGTGNDMVDVATGNDTVLYGSILEGQDIIDHFDGNASGGQDALNLDALFDALGVVAADRASRVSIVDSGNSVSISVDADGKSGNGFELDVATLNTIDVVSLGLDVVVGS